MSKENDIKYIKLVKQKTNISNICKDYQTSVSNVTFGNTTDEKINKVKMKLQKNIEELNELKDKEV